MHYRSVAAAIAMIFLSGCIPPAPGLPPARGTEWADIESEIHRRVNDYRRSAGMAALRYNDRIADVARDHSAAMAAGRRPFSHHGFDERARVLEKSLQFRAMAENLAHNDYPIGQVARTAVGGWIGSTGHRANMVGQFDMAGVGVARSAAGVYFITQIYVESR